MMGAVTNIQTVFQVAFNVITFAVTVGIAYGVVKTVTARNSTDIEKLNANSVNKVDLDRVWEELERLDRVTVKVNEWTDFKQELKERIKEISDFNKEIERKREKSSLEHHTSLSDIVRFMGRVEEYMRKDGG